MNQKVGLTGTKGWAGSFVGKSLIERNIQLFDLDDYTRERRSKQISHFPEDQLDWVIHLGAKTSIPESFRYPFGTYRCNIEGTMRAIEIAHQCHSKFIYISSYIYGNPRYLPIDEKHPVDPVNPYMSSKLCGELMTQNICGQLAIPYVILRPFNIYGKNMQRGRLISDLIYNVQCGDPLTLNDGAPRRDYLYIKDFCSLIEKILTSVEKFGIYNVGSGESHTNLEVAQIIKEIVREQREIVVLNKPRKNDVSECTMRPSLAVRDFDWHPTYTLKMGISEIFDRQL